MLPWNDVSQDSGKLMLLRNIYKQEQHVPKQCDIGWKRIGTIEVKTGIQSEGPQVGGAFNRNSFVMLKRSVICQATVSSKTILWIIAKLLFSELNENKMVQKL